MVPNFFEELGSATQAELASQTPPAPEVAEWLHAKISTDRDDDLHHTIGFGRAQVARGSHVHDGQDSMPLWQGVILTDQSGSSTIAQLATAINQLNGLIRQKVGS